MQKLAEISIRRPVFASMLILALVVVGATSYFGLGVDRFPSVDMPTVRVSATLPGATAEEMETQVAEVLEEEINTVQGIYELRSVSGPGTAIIIVTFDLERDIDVAAEEVRERVARVQRQLPEDIDPPTVSKFNNEDTPVLTLALSSGRSLRELTEYADKVVKPQLERSIGVGEVDLGGEAERAINIWIDPDRLRAYALPITAVRDALVAQNTEIPGGNLTRGGREESMRTLGRLANPEDFSEVVVANSGNYPIRVRDIGHVEDGTKERRSFSRLNGQPTVVLDIRRQSGANTVAVIEGIKEKLPQLQQILPGDVQIQIIRDQSTYIYAALHEIKLHLIIGSILAALVVLAFMRSFRSTLIAGVAIPASLIATFGMMWALDFTLNSVTMLALVLMVGIVIDDAIVVLENIYRFVEEKKLSAREAARKATAEIGLAVLATTLSLVVIFVPVSFMSSISGRFLYQFGITAAVSVMVSLLVSFTLTPMMASRILSREQSESKSHSVQSRTGFYAYLDRAYTRSLEFALAHRVAFAVVALVIIALSLPLYKALPQEFLPGGVDESEFRVTVTGPESASLEAMDEVLQQIETEVKDTPGVENVLATVGGGFLGSVNSGDVHVDLLPHDQRTFSITRLLRETLSGTPGDAFRGNISQHEVMQQVRRKLRKYSALEIGVRNYPSFSIGGAPVDIDFSILGPDLQQLSKYAENLRSRANELGLVDASVTLKMDKPETRVAIDRERAADLGVSVEDVALGLRLMVGGDDEVTRYYDRSLNEHYDVQLRLAEGFRNQPSDIPELAVPTRDGQTMPLRNLVQTEQGQTVSRIDRLDRQRMVALRASVAEGYAMGDRLQVLREEFSKLSPELGYSSRVVGRGRELENTFREFIWAFMLSIVLMYMILASQYESLSQPAIILLSLPLSVPFAFLSLALAGGSLNLYSLLGMLVLFGVVKKNAILQIDHTNQLRDKGLSEHEAILQANRERLRPILMTTLALVAGMIPLAVGTGPGAEERRAISIVVIGGQTLALFLTLLMTPVVYSLLETAKTSVLVARPDWAAKQRAWAVSGSSLIRKLFAREPRRPVSRPEVQDGAQD
ncbi:MAG TPA: efflux RND transporter permease subunit [Terriglobales bacterium]|nr:efflux RND transporter permease subunit [Terriglobales bacterium]